MSTFETPTEFPPSEDSDPPTARSKSVCRGPHRIHGSFSRQGPSRCSLLWSRSPAPRQPSRSAPRPLPAPRPPPRPAGARPGTRKFWAPLAKCDHGADFQVGGWVYDGLDLREGKGGAVPPRVRCPPRPQSPIDMMRPRETVWALLQKIFSTRAPAMGSRRQPGALPARTLTPLPTRRCPQACL